MTGVSYLAGPQTIQDLINRYQNGTLNLEPGFQRRSVWSDNDRRKLIDSVVRGYPLPAIFLYKRQVGGRIIYDVVDGKQRLETILMFTNCMRGRRFSAKLQLADSGREEYDWNKLKRKNLQHLITGYRLQVIEVDGNLSDIIDIFVRINSTGKALSSAEKRHAKYYSNSNFLKAASNLAERLKPHYIWNGVFSDSQVSRMKHIELTCELMLSVAKGEPINKKAALDQVMSAEGMTPRQITNASKRTLTAVNRTLKILPKLKATRFRKVSDFYSLVFLFSQFEEQKLILTDKRRNQLASDLLTAFSNGVDEVRERQKRVRAPEPDQEVYRDYLLTVSGASDDYQNRRKRHQMLRELLQSLFERMDSKRGFTTEQRRILWNTADKRKCGGCRADLTWEDFTIDHINPYSKGGRSQLDNAALYCRSCNSSKGNRVRRRRAA